MMTDKQRAQLRTWANAQMDSFGKNNALLPLALKALDELEELMGYEPLEFTAAAYPTEFENELTLDHA